MTSNVVASERKINSQRGSWALRAELVGVAGLVFVACATESPLSPPVAVSDDSTWTDTSPPTVTSTATAPTFSEGPVAPAPVTTPVAASESGETGAGAATADSTIIPAEGSASSSAALTDNAADTGAGEGAIAALEAYLETPAASRLPIDEQSFSDVPLSAAQSATARDLLWQDHVDRIRETRADEHSRKSVTIGDHTLRYDYTTFGDAPVTGRSLYISLHGGGEAEASVNDDQWENQKLLYQPDEGIYLSPRAPTDTWNMWHQDHIDPLFEHLIENFVVLEGVNPNRVYVMGYSAGGDGVYQLGPRMADHWAAASAMAGHPNEAKPFSLRNIGFTIHVGAEDTAFDRNLVAVEWREQLQELQAADPLGYEHVVEVHAGKPHWMDLEDAVAVPWMGAFTRNPVPQRVVWYQDDILHDRFYWLRDLAPRAGSTLTAEVSGQRVTVHRSNVQAMAVMLSDAMLNLDQSVTIVVDEEVAHEAVVSRTIGTLHTTLMERGDPALMFPALVELGR